MILQKIYVTGLPTQDETLKTTVRNLINLFTKFMVNCSFKLFQFLSQIIDHAYTKL